MDYAACPGLPWLMHRVYTLLNEESKEEDWHDIFQQFDPRKPFEPELCTKCISLVTVLDCGASVYLINKDEAAMNQLMLFLHDGSCACKCSGKRRFYFSLLDVIAASGSMEGLRACVAFIQDHLDTTRSAISVGCKLTEIKRRLACGFPKLDFENADDRNPSRFPFSSTEGGVQKRLLSPNCDGQYEERKTFQGEPSSLLENEPIHPHHCFENDDASPLSHSQNSNADRAEHDLPGETLGATCSDHAHYHGPSEAYPRRSVVHPESLHATKEHHPVFQSSDVNTKPWPSLFCSNCSCTNATADISAGSTAPPKPDGKKYYSGCCSSKTDVDCLRQHLDQVSLLSMSAQALYYNNVEMMVCAGALTPISIAELVRMTGNIPLTDALLYLYFMSTEDKEKFSITPEDEINVLYERTLPVEVSKLCQMAWQDATEGLTESFARAQSTTLYIDLCVNCEKAHFPDLTMYGKTSYVKFRRGFHENAKIFNYIKTRGCACETGSVPGKHSFAVYPELAAAVSGNLQIFTALCQPWLMRDMNNKTREQNLRTSRTPKPCTKRSSKTERSTGGTVSFMSELKLLGESRLGTALRHALYGNCDDILNFLLDQMTPWPLAEEETIACLKMCLLMKRDDLFLRLTLQSGLGTGSTIFRKCRTGMPLMMAASHGRLLLVNVLLARGADPLLENLSGVTAIEMALESNYIDSELIALRMLSGVSDTEIGKTLIVPALYHGKMHVAKYLLHHGVRTAYSTPNVWTRVRSLSELEVPLVHWWLGTTYNSAPDTREVLKLLLSEGLEVNTKDPQSGRTPLHTATFRISDPDVLEMLLSHGACANARDHEGVTPLCGAVRANHLTQIPPLVRAGACLQGCEKLFGIAVSLRRFQVILLLLHAGYNPSSSDMKTLVELGPRVPEPIQVLISSVRSEPTPLPMLCAAVLRETLQDRLNSYLDSVGCPDVVRSFIHLEHLCKRFLDLDSWNRILQWGQ